MHQITRYWYHKTLHPLMWPIMPLSWLFSSCMQLRRNLYQTGMLKMNRVHVPVIVVGNITVGGTGKTPLVIWLTQFLREQGFRPGIVSRGVGGKKHTAPYLVRTEDQVQTVGDEALMLARKTDCPIMIGTNRAENVRQLLYQTNCNIIVSDDGLQHYRLARDIEIVMIDGLRRFGNQQLLPAGPLREPTSRLDEVDFVLVNEGNANLEFTLTLAPNICVCLQDSQQQKKLSAFRATPVHAVAALGAPDRFFNTLRKAGLMIIPHVFPDHYLYKAADLNFNDGLPVIMTEKDAIKCEAFARAHYWMLQSDIKIDERFKKAFKTKLMECKK